KKPHAPSKPRNGHDGPQQSSGPSTASIIGQLHPRHCLNSSTTILTTMAVKHGRLRHQNTGRRATVTAPMAVSPPLKKPKTSAANAFTPPQQQGYDAFEQSNAGGGGASTNSETTGGQGASSGTPPHAEASAASSGGHRQEQQRKAEFR
ncbi:hypothetical protein KI387_007887, partial [Taxus chinensis]